MFRPKRIKVFEPTNPEYSLIDSMTSEVFENYSPEIAWWSLNRTETEANRDELSEVYGESKPSSKMFDGPFPVAGAFEINPIIQELTRLGLEQIEEVDFYCNIAAMQEYTEGRDPKGGDVFRVTWLETNSERRFVFYNVSNVTPVDIYNYRHINWLVNAEQTTLHDVPDEIKEFYEGQ